MNKTTNVRIASSLADLGSGDPATTASHQARLASLTATFRAAYPSSVHPTLLARAPGRVNLIGEHIDYCGFSVLPMALDCDLLVLVGTRPTAVGSSATVNVRSHEFADQPVSFAAADPAFDASVIDWGNYFKAGYIGARKHFGLAANPDYDLFAVIDSTVPPGSGLSSSAAMIVSTLLACIGAELGTEGIAALDTKKLTQVAIDTERLVGVNSGGMDQSISVMASRGQAAVIHFTPKLDLTPVPLPKAAAFVVAHSLVTADKAVTAATNYNLRVVETRLAAAILAAHAGRVPLTASSAPPLILADLVDWTRPVVPQLEQLHATATTVLAGPSGTGEWTDAAVAAALSLGTSEAMREQYMSAFAVTYSTLKLRNRATHVLAEARRVLAAADAMSAAGETADSASTFGALMDASHASCRDLFECSHPDVDALVALGKANGALGARVTGAGWGGCTVHLVPDAAAVDAFVDALYDAYYKPRRLAKDKAVGTFLFATRASAGATVLPLAAPSSETIVSLL
ncbi:ribosomal protein S5 domain 2-type protein [Blastocladiella britannica]|nr:ribosomal protein S5 domain 2-type protein [Blastocladiella britannica]